MPAIVVSLPARVEAAIQSCEQRQAAVEAAVSALQSSWSNVPVRTGRLKRGTHVSGSGCSAAVANGVSYASYQAKGFRTTLDSSRAIRLMLNAIQQGEPTPQVSGTEALAEYLTRASAFSDLSRSRAARASALEAADTRALKLLDIQQVEQQRVSAVSGLRAIRRLRRPRPLRTLKRLRNVVYSSYGIQGRGKAD